MRSAFVALILAGCALGAAGCTFVSGDLSPEVVAQRSERPDPRACRSVEDRDHGCDRNTSPLPTGVTQKDVRRQDKALRRR